MRNLKFFLSILFLFLFVRIPLLAQQTTLSSGGNGTGSGGTFSYSFGQFAFNTYFESSSSVAQGVQHPYETYIIPSLLSLSDTTIASGVTTCFDALQNITIAGEGGPVIIESSAKVDFIAGKSILIMPGFYAHSGSFVHGYINITSDFCNGSILLSNVQVPPDEKDIIITEPQKDNKDFSHEMQVKIYPNPNNGRFLIDLINFENKATVSVYNLLGTQYYHTEFEKTTYNEINLSTIRKGIYFVKINSSHKQFVKKIIVN
jgi:hypothetical protein